MSESRPPHLIYDWNQHGSPWKPPRPVQFDDETLRDGLQSPSTRNPSIDEKIEILRLMDRLGIDRVDLGLPGAGPQHLEHIDALLGVIVSEGLSIRPGCAVRTVVSDIEPMVDLQQKHGIPIQASAFLGTSPIRRFVENWTSTRLLSRIEETVRFASGHEIPIMLVTEDTTRSTPATLRRVYSRAIELGARSICLADTVGHATPHGVRQLVRYIRKIIRETGVPDVVINWHGHSDRGLALANCLAAIEAGADVIHGTALGIGERVGNAQMDLLLVNLKLMGWIDHDLTDLADYCRSVSQAVGFPIPPSYPVMGSDAFVTATGVHAAAIVKAFRKGDAWLADRVYSGVPAGDFGLEQDIRMGPMSGRSNVIYWLERHKIPARPELVQRLLDAAKASSRLLGDDEIMRIVSSQRRLEVTAEEGTDG